MADDDHDWAELEDLLNTIPVPNDATPNDSTPAGPPEEDLWIFDPVPVGMFDEPDEYAAPPKPRKRATARKPRVRKATAAPVEPVAPSGEPGPCPEFKAVTSLSGKGPTLRAPGWCMTIKQVVQAFNADCDFAMTGVMTGTHGMAVSRQDLWSEGHDCFLVYYRRGERMMGLEPK